MDERIIVEVKSVYGIKKVYPVCKKAYLFAGIAGTKTLSPSTVDRIKLLGFGLVVQPETI